MIIIGIADFIALSILGVHYAAVLAILGGLTEVIPYIGPWLGLIPAFIIAFTISPVKAFFVLIAYVLIQQFEVNEQWMPFFAALVFIPILTIGIWMLSQIPEPNQEDISLRTERVPMDAANRKKFFLLFWPGIFLVVAIYVGLTVFRDLRDNFAVELWTELGYLKTPWILVFAEIPIAVIVLIIIGSMILIKNNKKAFYLSISLCVFSGIYFKINIMNFFRNICE
jgi:hypothetical protein